jgi:four helix bundle protein
MNKGLSLENLKVYSVAMEIGELIWAIVCKWDYFSKKTLGAQLVSAADSIAFNIAEGFGRYHYKENKNFCYYSRGSAKEVWTGINKARTRKLISENEFDLLQKNLNLYFVLVYRYINSIGSNNLERNADQKI